MWQNFATKITWYYIVDGHYWIRFVAAKDNKDHYSDYDPHVKVVDFIKHYVSLNMKYWMRKNETETSADYAARLSEQNNAYAQEVYAELAVDTYRKLYPEEKLFTIGDYDLDDKSFLVKTDFGSVAMNVPESEFIKFKTRWNDGSVVLADGKNMKTMQNLTPLSFHHTEAGLTLHRLDVIDNVAVNSYIANSYIPYRGADYTDVAALPDVDIALVGDGEGKDKGKGGGEIHTAPSDVDTNIPYGSIARAAKTFVVIVDNENYRQLAKVPFALNDGRIFAEYCTRTFGIPADNVMRYDNATYGMMLEALTRLGNIRQGVWRRHRCDILLFRSRRTVRGRPQGLSCAGRCLHCAAARMLLARASICAARQHGGTQGALPYRRLFLRKRQERRQRASLVGARTRYRDAGRCPKRQHRGDDGFARRTDGDAVQGETPRHVHLLHAEEVAAHRRACHFGRTLRLC